MGISWTESIAKTRNKRYKIGSIKDMSQIDTVRAIWYNACEILKGG